MSGVNFHPVAKDTAKSMRKVVDYILGLNISPADKSVRLAKVFNLVGSDFYAQMFDANSELFDSTAIGMTDYNQMTEQIERLSRKIVRNSNLNRDVNYLINDFYNSALGNAQNEAFKNAISLDKHPTLTRTVVGETCDWCFALAGTYTNPEGELFARHANCDCLFVVSGYNSRNGILTNYNKRSKRYNDSVKIIDKKSELLRNARPGVGTISKVENWPKGQRIGSAEVETANWLLKTIGGDIKYIPRGKNPSCDYKWDGDNLELKTMETSKSLDRLSSNMAKAQKQIHYKGGVMLHFPEGSPLWKRGDELFNRIKDDMGRFDIDFVIVRHGNELAKYYVKEKGSP